MQLFTQSDEYLEKFAPKATDKRIVEDENIITARGVTSPIDLGLFYAKKSLERKPGKRSKNRWII